MTSAPSSQSPHATGHRSKLKAVGITSSKSCRTTNDHQFDRAARVALYVRVSTTRQAEADLSIPDQIKQGEAYCQHKGWEIVARYTEPGASATDDRRPEFQSMIDAAIGSERPYDVVLVHSMSRFFRDQFQSEFYIRKLRRVQVQVVSMTQQFDNDPTGQFLRKMLGSFDECQSQENVKHALGAMRRTRGRATGTAPFRRSGIGRKQSSDVRSG